MLTDFCGNCPLQNDFKNTLFEMISHATSPQRRRSQIDFAIFLDLYHTLPDSGERQDRSRASKIALWGLVEADRVTSSNQGTPVC